MSDEFVTIDTFMNVYEADAAKMYLEQEGIDVFLKDFNVVAFDWFLSNAVGHIKLQVREADAERARAILEETRPHFSAKGEKEAEKELERETCLECGEPMPADVERCPKCGWSYETGETAGEEGAEPRG